MEKSKVKIKNITLCLAVLPCYFLLLPFGYAQSVSSTELINNAKLYDGKTVVYEGEAIGDIMARAIPGGKYAWVNLNDGQNAIGIWMSAALSRDIRLTGSYKSRGDWIEVAGIFHRACLEHGGDLDIHAEGMRTIQGGQVIVERANLAKRKLFFSLAGILCLTLILRQFKRA